MSRTGIRAFTLVEVMAATAVLSLGAVLLYQSFFLSLDTYDYCADYLRVSPLAEEKVWEIQDELSRRGDSAAIEGAGEFLVNKRVFPWSASYESIDSKHGLYRIDFSVSWRKGRKDMRLSRNAYARHKE